LIIQCAIQRFFDVKSVNFNENAIKSNKQQQTATNSNKQRQ